MKILGIQPANTPYTDNPVHTIGPCNAVTVQGRAAVHLTVFIDGETADGGTNPTLVMTATDPDDEIAGKYALTIPLEDAKQAYPVTFELRSGAPNTYRLEVTGAAEFVGTLTVVGAIPL